MGVKYNVTPLGCCSNSIVYPFSATITPYTDFDFYGVLQQHLNFNSVPIFGYIIESEYILLPITTNSE